MYSAVIALPWLAPELQHLESDPEGLTVLASSVEQYLAVRPRSEQPALNPFLAGGQGDAVGLGDGGGATFLPQVGCRSVDSLQLLYAAAMVDLHCHHEAAVVTLADNFPRLAFCVSLHIPSW